MVGGGVVLPFTILQQAFQQAGDDAPSVSIDPTLDRNDVLRVVIGRALAHFDDF